MPAQQPASPPREEEFFAFAADTENLEQKAEKALHEYRLKKLERRLQPVAVCADLTRNMATTGAMLADVFGRATANQDLRLVGVTSALLHIASAFSKKGGTVRKAASFLSNGTAILYGGLALEELSSASQLTPAGMLMKAFAAVTCLAVTAHALVKTAQIGASALSPRA